MTYLNEMADNIGDLRSRIKILQDELKTAEGILKAEGCTIVDGEQFRVAISYDIFRSTTNWKTIAKRFEPSRQLVKAHTTISSHDRVTVSALLTN